jgi:DNA-binding transcriptional LysR family regulator
MQQLEERLDAVLIQRTTRHSRITELGEVFYQHARAAIDEVEQAEAALIRKKNTLSGKVSISCSVGVAQFALKEVVVRFLKDNPAITVLQHVTNENVDLVASGIDMSIRGHLDLLPDSALVQRSLAVVEWNLFASPDYPLDEKTITTPADLSDHHSLALGWQAHADHWRLEHKNGTKTDIQITPRFKSDDMATLKEAASEGLGIVALPAYTCRHELASGRLVKVLPEWHAGQANLSLVIPRRRGLAAPVVALRKFLQAHLSSFVTVP